MANYRQIPDLLREREPFEGNTMRAERREMHGDYLNNLGRVPRGSFESVPYRYVVFSYATPIAAVTYDEEVIVPDAGYSVTTTRQQNLCRVYL